MFLLITIIQFQWQLTKMSNQNYVMRYVRLVCPEDIDGYLIRQSEPNNMLPRIIINAKNQQILSVYLEKPGEYFNSIIWREFPENVILDHLETSILGLMILKAKFGCFRVTQNLVRLYDHQRVKVWIHDDTVLNYREYPLPNQSSSQYTMVGGLLKLFKPLLTELDYIHRPQTLQQFLNQVHNLKQHMFFQKHIKVELSNIYSRKQIRSFYQTNSQKPSSVHIISANQTLDSSRAIHNHNVKPYSPNNFSYSQQKKFQNNSFDSPKESFNRKPASLVAQLKKQIVNFTYSNPYSVNSSIPYAEIKQLDSSTYRRDESYQTFTKEPDNRNSIRKVEQSEERQKVFDKPKFPHSTQSTFVTLKQTKSYVDVHYFDSVTIEEEQSQCNMKTSSKQKSVEESRCDIEADLQNLFVGQDQQQDSKQQQQFVRRELQFQEILFN